MAAAVIGIITLVWGQFGRSANKPAIASGFLGTAATGAYRLSPPVHRIDAIVTPAPQTRMSQVSADDIERVLLEHGTVMVQVAPLHGAQRFLVATQDAEVEVRGTRFSVTATQGSLREVVVHEGLVEVRHGGVSLMLGVGDRWSRPETSAADPASKSTAATASAARRAGSGSGNGSGARAAAGSGSSMGSGNRAAAGASARSAAFARAVRLMETGEHAEASSALDKFARENGSDPRAEDAAFLAIIALQRSGRHAAAATAARDYLRTYPKGFRRADAAAIVRSAGREKR